MKKLLTAIAATLAAANSDFGGVGSDMDGSCGRGIISRS
jgi:hypothetical protein